MATGDAYTVGASYAGKYLKVVATAKQGVPGFGQHETEAGRILAQGVATLSRVSILNAGKAAMDTGTTLEAMAYTGDYWSETAVTEGVSYTWRWSDKDPDSYAVDFDPGYRLACHRGRNWRFAHRSCGLRGPLDSGERLCGRQRGGIRR